ncbi:MAG: aldo/keto reductase [Eubacteriales bacterium]|nr:aldo/keto reductase [Eubacteriales bacterium]
MNREMKYASVPYVDKKVSRVVFGTDRARMMANEDEFELLDQAFDAGINTFDSAACYGDAEASLGRWIKSRGLRNKVVILTKGANANDFRRRTTPFDIMSDIEDSFAKLQTDYIDIYALHRDDPTSPVGPVVELLNDLHNQGKIGAFGGSNWTMERTMEANAYAKEHGLIPFTICSPSFSLAECLGDPWGGSVTLSGPRNAQWRAWIAENKMPVFAYSSLARGFLSGRLKSTDEKIAHDIISFGADEYGFPINYERLRRTEILAKEKGFTVSQIAYAWVMQQGLDVFGLTKPGSRKHIDETIESLYIQLTDTEKKWLNCEIEER